MQLARQETAFGMVAAEIDHFGTGRLQLGDERGEILVARRDGIIMHFRDAALVDRRLESVGQTLAIGALVVDHGDLLVLQVLQDVIGHDFGLLVVAAAGAEHVFQIARGQVRAGGGRSDHQDVVFRENVGNRNGDAGRDRADNELDAVADDLVGGGNALLRFTGIVGKLQNDFLALDAASRRWQSRV